MDEPRYVDFDDTFGDQVKNKRKVFQTPHTDFQKRILLAVRRKYFSPKKAEEFSRVREIEKAMLPLTDRVISKFPTEWVNTCIEWTVKARREGRFIALTSLLNLIENEDRKNNFIAKWQNKNRGKLHDLDDVFEGFDTSQLD